MAPTSTKAHVEIALPFDIISTIFDLLARKSLLQVAKVNRRWHHISTPLIYRSIELVDDMEQFFDGIEKDAANTEQQTSIRWVHAGSRIRMIAKTLVGRPELATHIHTLKHSCHISPPEPLSYDDERVHTENNSFFDNVTPLLQEAVKLMVNVRTLYIIYGHAPIVEVLLNLLVVSPRLERLWIEATDLAKAGPKMLQLIDETSKLNLRSIRIRRSVFWHGSRNLIETGGGLLPAAAGLGDDETTEDDDSDQSDSSEEEADLMDQDDEIAIDDVEQSVPSSENQETSAHSTNGNESQTLASASQLTQPLKSLAPEAPPLPAFFARQGSLLPCLDIASSLTSLVLDWILPIHRSNMVVSILPETLNLPLLTSFQFRQTEIAMQRHAIIRTYLSNPIILSFLLRHPKISVFAWPAEWFISTDDSDGSEWAQLAPVIENMSRRLTFFRTEIPLQRRGEPHTGYKQSLWPNGTIRRASRSKVVEFVSKMEVLEILKIEGGIPRDELADMLAAAKNAPLKKVVLIGTSWPFQYSRDMSKLGMSSTIEELKFCGFDGAPVVGDERWWSDVVDPVFIAEQAVRMDIYRGGIQSLKSFPKLKYMKVALMLSAYPFVDLTADVALRYGGAANSGSSRALAGIVDSAQLISVWKSCIHGLPFEPLVTNSPQQYKQLLEYTPKRLAEKFMETFEHNLSKEFRCLRLLFLVGTDAERLQFEIYNFNIYVEWREGPFREDEKDKEREHDEAMGNAKAPVLDEKGNVSPQVPELEVKMPASAMEPEIKTASSMEHEMKTAASTMSDRSSQGRFFIREVVGPQSERDAERLAAKLRNRKYF